MEQTNTGTKATKHNQSDLNTGENLCKKEKLPGRREGQERRTEGRHKARHLNVQNVSLISVNVCQDLLVTLREVIRSASYATKCYLVTT